jgi:hypothetical protein
MHLRLGLLAASLSCLLTISARAQRNDDFFNRGVGLFEPIIDVVNSGSQLIVQPTVSPDRKYVTVSGRFEVAQVVRIETFPFFSTDGFNGIVGNARSAPALAGDVAPGPVPVRPAPPQGVLDQPGMTRLGD